MVPAGQRRVLRAIFGVGNSLSGHKYACKYHLTDTPICTWRGLGGGQAVVLHRLAIKSKDGDWLLREDGETMRQVLSILEGYGATYRFGAPLARYMGAAED